jgi:tRNA(Leu) C34 or U34 (ribose-2'-O)-methylase TrmL
MTNYVTTEDNVGEFMAHKCPQNINIHTVKHVNNLNIHVDIIPMDGYPLDAKQLDKDGLDYFLTVQFQQIYK